MTILTAPNNNGLVGYWPLDEMAGDTAHDMSGNKNHGQLVNNPVWTDGVLGGALKFNGSNQYINTNDNVLNISFSAFSISCWIKRNVNSVGIFIAGKMGTGGKRGWQFSLLSDNTLDMDYFNSSSGSEHEITSTNIIPVNIWTHCVFTFNASISEVLYINGILNKQQTSGVLTAFNGNNTASFRIADRGDGTATRFSGSIDEVRIYNRALSQNEITTLYNAGASKLLAATNNGLVGHWSFDDIGDGNTAHDFSGNGNHGTLVNSPTWVDGILGKALKFNGSSTFITSNNLSNFPISNNARTFSVWIYVDRYVDFQTIFNYGKTVQNQGWNVSISSSGQGRKLAVYGYSNNPTAFGNTMIPLNRWVHILITFSGTSLNYYFNGLSDGSATHNNINTVLNNQFTIGRSIDGWDAPSGTYFWPGKLDDLRLYNRVLTPAEITTLYNAGLSKLS